MGYGPRIIDLVRDANHDVQFRFNRIFESAQIARYGSERPGHFDWHSDIGHGPLAGKAQINHCRARFPDPQDYDGGALEVMASTAVATAPVIVVPQLFFELFTASRHP